MIQDQDLFIQQINKKEKDAFRLLFQRFYKSLVHFSQTYVKNLEQAEDIVQDVFLRIWESKTKINSYNEFRTMLYASVRNASLNWLKHKDVENRYINYFLQNPEESEQDIEIKIMKEELYQSVLKYVEQLPERRKEIFNLYTQGKKTHEIASILKISPSTVKGARFESLRFLREKTKYLIVKIANLK